MPVQAGHAQGGETRLIFYGWRIPAEGGAAKQRGELPSDGGPLSLVVSR